MLTARGRWGLGRARRGHRPPPRPPPPLSGGPRAAVAVCRAFEERAEGVTRAPVWLLLVGTEGQVVAVPYSRYLTLSGLYGLWCDPLFIGLRKTWIFSYFFKLDKILLFSDPWLGV